MVQAINQNKWSIAKKLFDLFKHESSKIVPELSDELEEVSEEDLMKLFSREDREK